MSKRKAEAKQGTPEKKQKEGSTSGQEWLDKLLEKAKLEELAKDSSDVLDEKVLKACLDTFRKIAERLTNEVVLMVNGQPHRFVEIEFYYQAPHHPDGFTHGNPVQAKFGKWYFHRMGPGKAYKSGTYKGLDLSFGGQSDGKKKDKAYGGVLIRAIQPLNQSSQKNEKKKKTKGPIIEGSCTCVDHLLSVLEEESIEKFINKNFSNQKEEPSVLAEVGSDKLFIRAATANELKELKVYQSPRVGLTLKRNLKHLERFLFSPLRFHVQPQHATKGKHHLMVSIHYLNGLSAAEVAKAMQGKTSAVQKCIASFEAGKKSQKDLKSWAAKKTMNNDDFCQAYGRWTTLFSHAK